MRKRELGSALRGVLITTAVFYMAIGFVYQFLLALVSDVNRTQRGKSVGKPPEGLRGET